MKIKIDEIATLVGVQLGRRHVEAGHRFMEDLGAESADLVNVVAAVEDRYGVCFDVLDVAGIRTVGQLLEQINRLLGPGR